MTRGRHMSMMLLILLLVSLATQAAVAAPITLRAGHNQVPDYPHALIIYKFAGLVAEKTNGEVTIQVFDNAVLGNEREMVEGLQLGTLDMCKSSTAILSGFQEQFQVFDLPYIFRDLDHLWKVLEGPIGERMMAGLETIGLKGLIWMEQGTRNFYTKGFPVNTPSDLRGKKIRVLESPIMVATINALGASATPMPWTELYTALKQGVVDGAENAPDAAWYSNQYEVIDYFNMTNHFMTPCIFMISLQSWNKLTSEQQEAIMEAAAEAQAWGKTLYSDVAAELLDKIAERGVEIVYPDETPFREALKPVIDRFAPEIGLDLVREIQETE